MPVALPAPAAAPEQPLQHWLRLLWGAAPPLHLDSPGGVAPYIAGGALHLPPQPAWHQHRAAAAHAAAHLVYSPRRFMADGLVPTARALLALLEDARVEALAVRELPGLARLWRPQHQASPASGSGCEALLARLARALADPGYRDHHPWVAKGRALFFLDEDLGLPALRTSAELRSAALQLGHDIGQMRLPFNAKGYRPVPAYRDDHRWMWAADQLQAQQPPPAPLPVPADALQQPDDTDSPLPGSVSHQPEWDRLIRRLRPDWARVVEQTLTPAPPDPGAADALQASAVQASAVLADAALRPLGRQLLAPLRALSRPLLRRGRAAEGDTFHLDALLGWAIARRCGRPGDDRVHRARQHQAARSAVWLLVDSSASTAAAMPGSGSGSGGARNAAGGSVLQAAVRGTAATAMALQALGVACTVAAFRSNGRHAVQVSVLQSAGSASRAADPASAAALLQRLQALRPAGSTRLGAVLRHAGQRLGSGRSDARWVLLVSDGQPHDVDVHDPRYLVDDARHAVQAARRRGVRMACLTLAGGPQPEALRIFGRAGTQSVADLADLPRALRRLMG